jgi:hypothetical protein
LLQEIANGQVSALVSFVPKNWLPGSLVSDFYGISKKIEVMAQFNDPRGMYLNCFECLGQ